MFSKKLTANRVQMQRECFLSEFPHIVSQVNVAFVQCLFMQRVWQCNARFSHGSFSIPVPFTVVYMYIGYSSSEWFSLAIYVVLCMEVYCCVLSLACCQDCVCESAEMVSAHFTTFAVQYRLCLAQDVTCLMVMCSGLWYVLVVDFHFSTELLSCWRHYDSILENILLHYVHAQRVECCQADGIPHRQYKNCHLSWQLELQQGIQPRGYSGFMKNHVMHNISTLLWCQLLATCVYVQMHMWPHSCIILSVESESGCRYPIEKLQKVYYSFYIAVWHLNGSVLTLLSLSFVEAILNEVSTRHCTLSCVCQIFILSGANHIILCMCQITLVYASHCLRRDRSDTHLLHQFLESVITTKIDTKLACTTSAKPVKSFPMTHKRAKSMLKGRGYRFKGGLSRLPKVNGDVFLWESKCRERTSLDRLLHFTQLLTTMFLIVVLFTSPNSCKCFLLFHPLLPSPLHIHTSSLIQCPTYTYSFYTLYTYTWTYFVHHFSLSLLFP